MAAAIFDLKFVTLYRFMYPKQGVLGVEICILRVPANGEEGIAIREGITCSQRRR